MNSHPNYEQLYHVMNQRRGEEIIQLKKLTALSIGLMHMFEKTDRMVADCAETQVIQLPVRLEQRIHEFLLKLDPSCYFKRHSDTWQLLTIMTQEDAALVSMKEIYAKATIEAGCNAARIKRNVRNFRKAAAKLNTEYHAVYLAQYNQSNSVSYRRAAQLLKEEMAGPLPFPTKE